MTFTFNNNRGFTLVETLVAIAILMIAIAGPLVIASKGLRAALYARDQMTATFLAQESMEIIKNFRDNNMRTSGDETLWLNNPSVPANQLYYVIGSSNFCSAANNTCDASAIDSPVIITGCGAGCQLYNTANGYSHVNVGNKTLFKRGYYMTHPAGYPGNEVTATVVIDWTEGTIPYEIKLSSELLATER